ncbi:MAG: biotin--[acetyl-CoA-carboxylase] ligase [Chitinivibrionales bacterium]|nr:biotin--[acetyl-CoA-carboxylase] ligase [Chitinivibrionales bacterium]MBD3394948.1 biotin--[acetyl-CoA-carboxylase] ligase [Chitinivibrionales bacterium]
MNTTIESLDCVNRLVSFDEVDSTNTIAKQMLAGGVRPGSGMVVVAAKRQAAGRGREGRRFFSSVEGGLWVSLIVGIPDIADHFSVNRALSLAICEALEHHSPALSPRIKWPNDIYCRGRKICGMLLETSDVSPGCIVAGFGLNVNVGTEQFPGNLRGIATSVLIETGSPADMARLLRETITRFERWRRAPAPGAHAAYARRLYRPGVPVRIDGKEGIFDGVREDGCLFLRTEQGIECILSGTMAFL